MQGQEHETQFMKIRTREVLAGLPAAGWSGTAESHSQAAAKRHTCSYTCVARLQLLAKTGSRNAILRFSTRRVR